MGTDRSPHRWSQNGSRFHGGGVMYDDVGITGVVQKRVSRSKLPATIAQLPPCRIGMEACGSAHYWARELQELKDRWYEFAKCFGAVGIRPSVGVRQCPYPSLRTFGSLSEDQPTRRVLCLDPLLDLRGEGEFSLVRKFVAIKIWATETLPPACGLSLGSSTGSGTIPVA